MADWVRRAARYVGRWERRAWTGTRSLFASQGVWPLLVVVLLVVVQTPWNRPSHHGEELLTWLRAALQSAGTLFLLGLVYNVVVAPFRMGERTLRLNEPFQAVTKDGYTISVANVRSGIGLTVERFDD